MTKPKLRKITMFSFQGVSLEKHLDKFLTRCYNSYAVRVVFHFDITMAKSHPHKLVLIAMRVHLFPSRTQKLSSSAPTILGG